MAERPIIFSGPMIRAILAGRKTQTRRVVKPQPDHTLPVSHSNGSITDDPIRDNRFLSIPDCPYGKPGDLLYVRETWREGSPLENLPVYYKAGPSGATDMKWKPSIYMPKKYARIWLKVEDVRAERLQEITQEDAVLEGARSESFMTPHGLKRMWSMERPFPDSHTRCLPTARMAFAFYINRLHGGKNWNLKPSSLWDENPLVWIVEFSVISTTGRKFPA